MNSSDNQDHELIIFALDEGETAEETFEGFSYGGEKITGVVDEIGWISPGKEIEYTVDLAPGNYAIVCMLPTGHPGTPHVNLGMLGQITVGD